MWHTQYMPYAGSGAALCFDSLASTGSVLGCTSEPPTRGTPSSRRNIYIAPGRMMQRGQITATRAPHISLLRVARMSITELTLHQGVHSNHQAAAIRGVRPVIYPLALVVVWVQHPSTRAFPYWNHLLRINEVTKKWCLQWQSLMHVP